MSVLTMAAGTKCQCVSSWRFFRFCGAWNSSSCSKFCRLVRWVCLRTCCSPVLRAQGAEELKDTGQSWAVCEAKHTGDMSFLSSTFHSLGIFEKISGIKEALKNRLLDITQRQYRAGGQQRKRPHTSETALRCLPLSIIPQTPLVLSPLRWGLATSIPPVLPQSRPLLFYPTQTLFLNIPPLTACFLLSLPHLPPLLSSSSLLHSFPSCFSSSPPCRFSCN